MPNNPYISGQGALIAAFTQLRKGFPAKVDAGYLKRFNIAPANESYVISILRFLDLIDDEGNKVEDNTHFFYGDENLFKQGFETAMRRAYQQVFSEMGDDALDADRSRLAHWFRASDRTTELVGNRQASTFQTLASLAGHGELPARATATKKAATNGAAPAKKAAAKKTAAKKVAETPAEDNDGKGGVDGEGDGDKGKVKVFALMMDAFSEDKAKIKLNALITESEVDEQKGFKFIFTGAATGIRNPRGHEVDIGDTPDEALDYLGLASLLLRRLDAAGHR